MGSLVSKSRTLPRQVTQQQPSITRTPNVDQLQRLKKIVNNGPDKVEQEYNNQIQTPQDARTLSNFISQSLGDIKVENEVLQLNPNNSSLKRLSQKKALEDEYKKMINNLGDKNDNIITADLLTKILSSINTAPQDQIISNFNITPTMYDKISTLSQTISVPTKKIQISPRRPREQMIVDSQSFEPQPLNELNKVFNNILSGSQTGYDINPESADGPIRNTRPAHKRLKNEVKRSF